MATLLRREGIQYEALRDSVFHRLIQSGSHSEDLIMENSLCSNTVWSTTVLHHLCLNRNHSQRPWIKFMVVGV